MAGGFHTPGLEKALVRREVAVGIYTPRVDVLPAGNPGLAALVEDPRPLEKIFAGEPLSLVSERPLGPSINLDGTRQRAVEGLLAAQIAVPLAVVSVVAPRVAARPLVPRRVTIVASALVFALFVVNFLAGDPPRGTVLMLGVLGGLIAACAAIARLVPPPTLRCGRTWSTVAPSTCALRRGSPGSS